MKIWEPFLLDIDYEYALNVLEEPEKKTADLLAKESRKEKPNQPLIKFLNSKMSDLNNLMREIKPDDIELIKAVENPQNDSLFSGAYPVNFVYAKEILSDAKTLMIKKLNEEKTKGKPNQKLIKFINARIKGIDLLLKEMDINDSELISAIIEEKNADIFRC